MQDDDVIDEAMQSSAPFPAGRGEVNVKKPGAMPLLFVMRSDSGARHRFYYTTSGPPNKNTILTPLKREEPTSPLSHSSRLPHKEKRPFRAVSP